ncbi:ankyrin repeat-containing domain protein [Flagelloscypha sp. PMI_526]|nr:ankyrin repeat-containing domain protein [Flagelloscypha sp. PMI_526]
MQSSDSHSENGKALRALSFDGSFNPNNALSELLILDEAGVRWTFDIGQDEETARPSEMFDIICGTGIGGFYAVMFAALNTTIGQAIQAHQLLSDLLFNSSAWLEKDQETCLAKLSRALDEIAKELSVTISLDQPWSRHAFTKAFVCVVNNSSAGNCRLLRNYRVRTRSPSCTIREALLVCLSDRVHIPPTHIRGEQFLNGVDGFANPTRTLMTELANAFDKGSKVACLVNIGAGHPGLLPLMNEKNVEETAALLRSCELVAEDIAAQCHSLGPFFLRFSISSSADRQYSGDSDFVSLMKGLTARYLNTTETNSRLDHLVEALQQRQGVITLERICSFAGENGHSQLNARIGQVQRHLDDTIFRDIGAWLKHIQQTSKLDSNIRVRGTATCRWLLANSTFGLWIKARGGLFWLHGLMGTGKTVMSSFVIQFLLAYRHIYTAYYYFEFTNPTTLSEEALFRSLVAQLAVASPAVMRAFYEQHNNGSLQPQLATLQITLTELISASPKPVFIVIDALDELPLTQRKYLLQSLLNFCTSESASQAHIMATSREEVDISRAFQSVDFELSVQGAFVRHDIAVLVDEQLAGEKWKHWPRNEIETMRRVLNEGADGQFRMVACQIEILQRVKSSGQLQEALSSLPQSLGDTYNHILERIPVAVREQAHRLFAILCFASKAISPVELSGMLAVEFSCQDDSDNLPKFREANHFHDPLDVIDLGTSLVSQVVNEYGTYLQLAHASVKEYLLTSRNNWYSLNEELSHGIIAGAALTLLLQSRHQDSLRPNVYFYSRDHWYYHVFPKGSTQLLQQQQLLYASYSSSDGTSSLASAVNRGLFDLVQTLLISHKWDADTLADALARAAWSNRVPLAIQCCTLLLSYSAWANAISDKKTSHTLRQAGALNNWDFVKFLVENGANANVLGGGYSPTALQSAAKAGELNMVQYLIKTGADVNRIGGEYGTALQAAALSDSLEVVQYLVERGADVNKNGGGEHGTALHIAASRGLLRVVQYLVEKGADVNRFDQELGPVLHSAASSGSLETVQYLIEKGADMDRNGGEHGTALQAAAYSASLPLVQYFVEKGADMNMLGGLYGTALQAAARWRRLSMVQYLVEMGADVNRIGGNFGTALQGAASCGAFRVVQYLMEKGADANGVGGCYGTPLHAAASSGSLETFKLLLEKGADMNMAAGKYGTALHVAARRGHMNIVQYLVESSADVNEIGGKYGTVLQAAARSGSLDCVQYLVGKEADVNIISGKFATALQAAARSPSLKIVQYLVEQGADVNGFGGKCGTAVQAAAWGGQLKIVQCLLEKGAHLDEIGGEFGTALVAAAFSRSLEVVQYLVENGADVNKCGRGVYGTALHIATYARFALRMTQYLVEKGANVNAIEGKYGTALQAAIIKHWSPLNIVRYLIEQGADANIVGGKYGTALQAAARRGRLNVVRFLVEQGAYVNATGGKFGTAVRAAEVSEEPLIVQYLVENGADVELTGEEFQTASGATRSQIA